MPLPYDTTIINMLFAVFEMKRFKPNRFGKNMYNSISS